MDGDQLGAVGESAFYLNIFNHFRHAVEYVICGQNRGAVLHQLFDAAVDLTARVDAGELERMRHAQHEVLAPGRRDEAEQAWKWVDEVSEAWAESGLKPDDYVAGTWGPDSADMLMARTGRDWNTTDV